MVPGGWHCCQDNYQWDPDAFAGQGACIFIIECLQPVGPCNFDPGTNFPTSTPTAWWTAPFCIDQSNACCHTDIFGQWGYHYLLNVAY